MICKNCKNEISNSAKFCDQCGTKVSNICNKCGAELKEDAKFCYECGTAVNNALRMESKSKAKEMEVGFEERNFFFAQSLISSRVGMTKKNHYYYLKDNNKVYRFSEFDKEFMLLFEAQDGISSRLNIIEDNIYFLDGTDKICKVKLDGTGIAQFDMKQQDYPNSMVIVGDRIYLGTYWGEFYSVDLDGKNYKLIKKIEAKDKAENHIIVCYAHNTEICILITHQEASIEDGYYIYDIVKDELKHIGIYVDVKINDKSWDCIAVDLYNQCIYVRENFSTKGIVRYDFGSTDGVEVIPGPNGQNTKQYLETIDMLQSERKTDGKILVSKMYYNGKDALAIESSWGNSGIIAKIDQDGYVELLSEDGDYLNNTVNMFGDEAFWYAESYNYYMLIDISNSSVRKIDQNTWNPQNKGKITEYHLRYKE